MRSLCIVSVLSVFCAVACTSTRSKEDAHAGREFRLEYATTISGFSANAKQVRVWVPLPTSDEAQQITDVQVTAPVAHEVKTEAVYGNRLAYFELKAPLLEKLPVTVTMNVKRAEIDSVSELAGSVSRARLLAGDQLAPLSSEARSRAARATRGRSGTVRQARGIYDQVLADVSYDKSGKGWGRGDLEYVCAAGKGNCSDFHTLFIAMARSTEIPALFEIGFPLPRDEREGTIGGYHCWAWYQDAEGRWRPVDASEADKDPSQTDYFFGTICENRVAFARGRDLVLNPRQSGGPVNFLIYPYVEVDGKPGGATVEKSFRFRDF